jgi:uncharacterized protein with HEPN domain
MKQSTTRRLLDALNAGRQILDVVNGTSFEELRKDQLRVLGFVKHFEVIGEALNRARKGEPRIEGAVPRLRRYVNLRNQLVHEYDKIDYRLVWQTAREGVPDLVNTLESVTGTQQDAPQLDRQPALDGSEAPTVSPERRPARQRR